MRKIRPRTRSVLAPVVVVLLGSVVLLSQSQFWQARPRVTPNSQPIRAHTIHLKDYVSVNDHTPSLSRDVVRAVKADGSAAEMYKNYDSKTGAYKWTQRVLLGVGGVYAEASPDIGLMSSLKQEKLDYRRLLTFGDAAKNCTELLTNSRIGEYLGRETILGYEALKIRNHEDNSSIGYQWRMPQFGCTVIRQETIFKATDGSIRDRNVLEPVSITAGDPSPEWFTFSEQFTLVSPLEYQRRLHRHLTGKDVPDAELPPSLFQLEALYKGSPQRTPARFDPRS